MAQPLPPGIVSIHAPPWEATDMPGLSRVASRCFNPRPPVGGDGQTSRHSMSLRSFNPRPPVGGDLVDARRAGQDLVVSIHAPPWEATDIIGDGITETMFQSTPPRGRRPQVTRVKALPAILFQSTPPRGRRPRGNACKSAAGNSVSIHAPPWEATRHRPARRHLVYVSIHAPPWEATCDSSCPDPSKVSFNPRPPVGGDSSRQSGGKHDVSIHAPPWEATLDPRRAGLDPFQSTPPRGRRLLTRYDMMLITRFQSTPPRGRRRLAVVVHVDLDVVSIHAPPWEATCRTARRRRSWSSFNPRPPVGGDDLCAQ